MSNERLPEDLEDFVSKEVASLCDADPAVLAQYIIALIGTEPLNDSLKGSLESKLTEFFDDQTIPFIDRLFAKIKGDGQAKQSSNKDEHFADLSEDEDDGDRNFKHRRQRAESKEEHGRSSSNKRRLDDENSANNTSKYQRGDERRSNMNPNSIPVAGYNTPTYDGNRGGRGAGRGIRGGRGGQGGMGRSRPQCRDYNEKGFCMRGDLCPYDHGVDRIIVDESATPFSGNPFPNNGNMPPMGPGGPQPFFAMPNIADAYDPERSGIIPTNEMGQFLPVAGMLPPNNDMMVMNGMMRNNSMYRGRGGRGAGRGGRGGRGGYQRNQQNHNPLNTTLNVEKIPPEFCQISTVNEFFSKFGTITNISVQPHAHRAVIQYSNRSEAERAYSSPDAIFDNRFVKVYWAKEESNNASTASDDKAPTSEVSQPAILPKAVNEPDPELVAARAAELAQAREEKQKKHQERMKQLLEVQKRRETQLKQQIEEQKRLLSKLENSAGMTQAEKAELLKALKSIQNDINISKSAAASATADSQNASIVGAEGSEGNTTDVSEAKGTSAETTEGLKMKLARLEAEAAALGVPGSGFRGGRGGYYGRGRGWPRMRGGMTRMTLDNRPTKLVAKNIPEGSTEVDLRQHFEQFGSITSFEKSDSEAYVQYSQRFEAEKALALGPNFTSGKLQLDWVNNNAGTTPAAPTDATATASNAEGA
ncbi:MAG: hypothetical protein EXX96DRAFT_575465 [Benjaminiella poitrasii]|nr:MAG: hypothetical protein EXX96DRAFT_575465 [Benjaminiella poitrasii]